jgi:CHAT domain-containing protein
MEKVRKLFCILLSLCSATTACTNGNDPLPAKMGEHRFRTVGPRLSNAEWKACCRKAEIRTSCEDKGDALAFIVTADRDCIDTALLAVQKHSRDDLAAAYYIRGQRKGDPVDYLRALQAADDLLRRNAASHAALFNRALAQEKLGLTQEAIRSWDDVVKRGESGWSQEAAKRRERLLNLRDPEWRIDKLEEALRKGDRAALTKIVRAFPSNSISAFEKSDLLDIGASRLFAEALNDPYARSIVDAVEHPKDRGALEQGMRALRQARTLALREKPGEAAGKYEEAATLLERSGNPLYIAVRYQIAAQRSGGGANSLALLDALVPIAEKYAYPGLPDIHTFRASELGFQDRYLEADETYKRAIASAKRDPTALVAALSRRSGNYARIGSSELAFRDSFQSLTLLSNVANLNARNNAYGAAATAARQLGYPSIALQYQNAAVEATLKGVLDAPAGRLAKAKQHLAIALRARADLYLELGQDGKAQTDLEQASELAEAADEPELRALLRMRIKEVIGQASLKANPRAAVAAFSEAIDLAPDQDSTYRAVLLYKRAVAHRRAGDPTATDADIAEALNVLRDEAADLVDSSKRGAYESLWTPYFSRFQAMHHDMIEGRIVEHDIEGAFVYAELARGFEPLQLILQSRSAVPGFRKIETKADLRRHLASLPDDTVILQYLVLRDHTYTWALSRNSILLFPQRASEAQIAEWVEDIGTAIRSDQNAPILRVMSAAYDGLFQLPLREVASRHRLRIVIVPDGPMHGLPFAALHSAKEGYVIERSSIAVAGSTSLYLYALQRDRQFRPSSRPEVLVAADPNLDLHHARNEATELGRIYSGATMLRGPEATTQKFLMSARDAAIIHFAGHGEANPQNPSLSRLRLAPDGPDSGTLTAEKLMTELSELERTRLVVLAACSTAGGVPVGPEGIAPLVRPIIAANVPAVVGTLWDVRDATVKNLLVSLHCHYRNGDDVAVALQQAQLEMLRTKEPARTWAAFQVVGYAGSPYASHAAMEKIHSEHICSQNSLHRPHGLHPQ